MTILATLGLSLIALPNFQTPDMKPPAEMKQLNYLVGEWSGKETYTVGGQSSSTTSTCVFKEVLLGRYLRMEHKAKMPGFGETEGMMLITYDPAKKKFQQWWYDSTGPGMADGLGTLEGDTLQFESNMAESGGMKMKFRITFVKRGAKEFTFKLESNSGETWSTFMEAVFKKK